MKYIISSGNSVVSNIKKKLITTILITISTDSDSAKKFDKYGDAMTACVEVNNLIGKHAFKVMTLNK